MNQSQSGAGGAGPKPTSADTERLRTIRQLNDELRREGKGGRVLLTAGLAGLGEGRLAEIQGAVKAFSEFSEANDPYGEHDCALMDIGPHRVLWKIEYFDHACAIRSPDPADPKRTQRVLTMMLAEEY